MSCRAGGFWFSWLETDELQKLPFEQVTSFAGMSELTAFLSVFSGYTLFSFSGKFQLYIYQYRTDNTEVKSNGFFNKNKKPTKFGFSLNCYGERNQLVKVILLVLCVCTTFMWHWRYC